MFAIGAAGAAAYWVGGGNVDFAVAGSIAIGGVLTSGLGARLTKCLDANTLKRILGSFMMLIAPIVPLRKEIMKMVESKNRTEEENKVTWDAKQIFKLVAIGLLSGFMAGLLGVGGGIIIIPLVAYFMNFSYHKVLGTTLCAMALPAFTGTVTHYRLGKLAFHIFCGVMKPIAKIFAKKRISISYVVKYILFFTTIHSKST